MTAHVAINEFITLAAAVPMPTARLHLPTEATSALDKEWNIARKAFERQIAVWRSTFLRHLGAMRSMLEQAVEEVGADIVGRVAVEQIAKMREVVAEATALSRARLDLDKQTMRKVELAASLSPQARKIGRKLLKEYRAAIERQVDLYAEAYDRLWAMELDFDPEAHSGKEFDNIHELLDDLHS